MVFGQKNSFIHAFILFGPFLVATLAAMTLTMPRMMMVLVGGLGFGMFLVAKLSILKTGGLISFGPTGMSKMHRKLYFAGYFLMGFFILVILINYGFWH